MCEHSKDIACLVLNYNDSDTTVKFVKMIEKYWSIKNVVIVDNCSTDNSYKRLEKMQNSKIHVIRTEKNGGYGYGNNYGIQYIAEKLASQYVLLCNPDVVISNECILKLKSVIETNVDCVLTAPIQRMYIPNGKVVPPWRLANTKEMVLSMSLILSKLLKINLAYDYEKFKNYQVFQCDVIQGALYLADIDFMYNNGKYDEEIFLYNEEECLAQKIKKSGKISLLYCNDYYLHQHSVSIDKSFKSFASKKKLQLKSRMQYLERYSHLSKVEKTLIALFFKYCLIEAYVFQVIKKYLRRG